MLFIRLRPKKKSCFRFPDKRYEIGADCKFLLPYPERAKKNKIPVKISWNQMKNDKVMTIFLLPNVIFLTNIKKQLCCEYFLLHFLKEWYSYPIKKWNKKQKTFLTYRPSSKMRLKLETRLSQLMRFWYLSHRRPAKAQESLCNLARAFTVRHMKYGSRWRVWQKIRHLAPLDGCACTFPLL